MNIKIFLGLMIGALLIVSGCFLNFSLPGQVATPSFNPSPGQVGVGTLIEISSDTTGAEIYYTTDGSTPDEYSQLYSSPIRIQSPTTFRAIAFKSPTLPSDLETATYTITTTGSPELRRSFSVNPASTSSAVVVTIEKVDLEATSALLVEETVPDQFEIVNVRGPGQINGHTISWAELVTVSGQPYTYEVLTPNEAGSFTFNGVYAIDGGSTQQIRDTITIIGDSNQGFTRFGTVTIPFDFQVNGNNANMDSIAFWEAPNPSDTLMFVTSRNDDLVQVWKYPFDDANRLSNINPPVTSASQINGVVVDQDLDRVFITESTYTSSSARNRVHVYDASTQSYVVTFGSELGTLKAEANLAILTKPDNTKWIYVTTNNKIWVYDLSDYSFVFSFDDPGATTLEEMTADDYHQRLYVMDENNGGPSKVVNPDGVVIGEFGSSNIYNADQEGVTLYTCPENGLGDDGKGMIIVSDQVSSPLTHFEFFDRESFEHLGTVKIESVKNTDGIASTQLALPSYPKGLFAVMDNDGDAAIVGWDDILSATGLSCD